MGKRVTNDCYRPGDILMKSSVIRELDGVTLLPDHSVCIRAQVVTLALSGNKPGRCLEFKFVISHYSDSGKVDIIFSTVLVGANIDTRLDCVGNIFTLTSDCPGRECCPLVRVLGEDSCTDCCYSSTTPSLVDSIVVPGDLVTSPSGGVGSVVESSISESSGSIYYLLYESVREVEEEISRVKDLDCISIAISLFRQLATLIISSNCVDGIISCTCLDSGRRQEVYSPELAYPRLIPLPPVPTTLNHYNSLSFCRSSCIYSRDSSMCVDCKLRTNEST